LASPMRPQPGCRPAKSRELCNARPYTRAARPRERKVFSLQRPLMNAASCSHFVP
jgi:hypothetical protein